MVVATEELPDAAALAAWVTQCGPVESSAPEPLVDAARSLREDVHGLLQAVHHGQPVADTIRRRLNAAAAQPVPVPRLDPAGTLSWRATQPVAATLALIARDALELAGSDAVHRLRTCAGPACGALFLDTSRPGTRRWCSMETCGNQAKKQTFRSRH